jgi:hypothetical protein
MKTSAASRAQIVTLTMWDIESGFDGSWFDRSAGRARNG